MGSGSVISSDWGSGSVCVGSSDVMVVGSEIVSGSGVISEGMVSVSVVSFEGSLDSGSGSVGVEFGARVSSERGDSMGHIPGVLIVFPLSTPKQYGSPVVRSYTVTPAPFTSSSSVLMMPAITFATLSIPFSNTISKAFLKKERIASKKELPEEVPSSESWKEPKFGAQ